MRIVQQTSYIQLFNYQETDFFKKIANRLSNPNVFVLYNKWDTVANDELSENPVESVSFLKFCPCPCLYTESCVNLLGEV